MFNDPIKQRHRGARSHCHDDQLHQMLVARNQHVARVSVPAKRHRNRKSVPALCDASKPRHPDRSGSSNIITSIASCGNVFAFTASRVSSIAARARPMSPSDIRPAIVSSCWRS